MKTTTKLVQEYEAAQRRRLAEFYGKLQAKS